MYEVYRVSFTSYTGSYPEDGGHQDNEEAV